MNSEIESKIKWSIRTFKFLAIFLFCIVLINIVALAIIFRHKDVFLSKNFNYSLPLLFAPLLFGTATIMFQSIYWRKKCVPIFQNIVDSRLLSQMDMVVISAKITHIATDNSLGIISWLFHTQKINFTVEVLIKKKMP